MVDEPGITTAAAAARSETLATIDALVSETAATGLSPPVDTLIRCRERLAGTSINLLVLGELKRGKSTFVNALVGRALLPTDVDVATCQVFRVGRAAQEAFRIRFEDGTSRDIGVGDLARLGSQVVIDREGAPRTGVGARTPRPQDVLRWIEVDSPMRFLPEGVNLLDTPGLGSLYAAHAQVTERFLPMADAAVFVLDSLEPIKSAELHILDSILKYTRELFFVQTKIDLVGKDEWPKMLERNQQILREKFGDRLRDTRVWPIASAVLLKAAEMTRGSDAFIHVSRHKEMEAALKAFLARVVLWGRTAEALGVATEFHAHTRRGLSARLGTQTEASSKARAENQARSVARMQAFQSEWGRSGSKTRELQDRLQKRLAVGKQGFRQAMSPGGEVAAVFEDQIARIDSVEKAERYARDLAPSVVGAASERWRSTTRRAEEEALEEITPFMDAVSIPAVTAGDTYDESPGIKSPELELPTGIWDRLKGVTREYMPMGVLASVFMPLVAPYLGIVAIPMGPLFAVAALIGWSSYSKTLLKGAQQELRRNLGIVLQQVCRYFFEVDESQGRFSRVDEHFEALQKAVMGQVQNLADQKLAQAKAEVARLDEESNLGAAALAAKAEETRVQLARLDAIGRSLASIGSKLQRAVR